ncbi:DUF3380 domain-containing protein [Rhodoblastus acidophilus]|uniref:DUF3380 domain-containing protein n=1 Tax=Rhodoblastus acidophilus TaxID=1074 RepID=A0A6N8DQG8_RHOAC|nr:DUF3380 domain-containing protein [Rhodoblastus acidophilus]
MPQDFVGSALRLSDIDLPTIGATIGCGEDEIHAVLDVESRGSGFDKHGRPIILFEPHIFYRLLSGPGPDLRARAVREGLAYENWGEKPYPADSYPRLKAAMLINETAALKSASWGLGQLLGSNHAAAGYATVQDMVAAFCASERNQLAGMIAFIKSEGLDRALRNHKWADFARGYNGPSYAKNQYSTRLLRRFLFWSDIKDTKVFAHADAATETRLRDPKAGHVVGSPPAPAPLTNVVQGGAQPGFWARFASALFRRTV